VGRYLPISARVLFRERLLRTTANLQRGQAPFGSLRAWPSAAF
jgi:hypothetical protein